MAFEALEAIGMEVHRDEHIQKWRRERGVASNGQHQLAANDSGCAVATSINVSLRSDMWLGYAARRSFAMKAKIARLQPLYQEVEVRMQTQGAPFVRGGLSRSTVEHVMTLLASYWGFLVHFRGCEERDCNNSMVLSDPSHLAEFWRYLATPLALNGRGNARAWVEARVSYMIHILNVMRSLGMPCAPGHQWEHVVTWWRVEVGRVSRCAQPPPISVAYI